MLLTEFRISDSMATAFQQFLKLQQNCPEHIVKKLFIDDCGMRDHQFASILEGVFEQNNKIKTLVYSSNDLG